MKKNSVLERSDYNDYLVYLYFGKRNDYLHACIDRAYLDFNRTLRGLGQLKSKDALREEAYRWLKQVFGNLKHYPQMKGQAEFDDWHRVTCQRLSTIYEKRGYNKFYIGQAQKWINMTLKYFFVLGEHRLPGFKGIYQYCHAPLDNVLLGQLVKYGFPKPTCAWSRLADYDKYLSYQEWIRQRFSLVPLDVEFLLWLGKEIPER